MLGNKECGSRCLVVVDNEGRVKTSTNTSKLADLHITELSGVVTMRFGKRSDVMVVETYHGAYGKEVSFVHAGTKYRACGMAEGVDHWLTDILEIPSRLLLCDQASFITLIEPLTVCMITLSLLRDISFFNTDEHAQRRIKNIDVYRQLRPNIVIDTDRPNTLSFVRCFLGQAALNVDSQILSGVYNLRVVGASRVSVGDSVYFE